MCNQIPVWIRSSTLPISRTTIDVRAFRQTFFLSNSISQIMPYMCNTREEACGLLRLLLALKIACALDPVAFFSPASVARIPCIPPMVAPKVIGGWLLSDANPYLIHLFRFDCHW